MLVGVEVGVEVGVTVGVAVGVGVGVAAMASVVSSQSAAAVFGLLQAPTVKELPLGVVGATWTGMTMLRVSPTTALSHVHE